jgi:uncharacterized protein (TIGR04255 family)
MKKNKRIQTKKAAYANPPLVEVVCEFRLSADTQWDPTVPGLLYEKVKQTFPHKDLRLIQALGIVQSPTGVQQQMNTRQDMLFQDEDRKTWLDVGPHCLRVHRLKPYSGWQAFKPRIEAAFEALKSVVNVQGLDGIELTYVNRISIPGPTINLNDYFSLYPNRGTGLPEQMSGFGMGCTWPYSAERDRCLVQMSTILSEREGQLDFLLNVQYSLAKPQGILPTQVMEWVENAHQQIETIFEGCITERLRKTFKG